MSAITAWLPFGLARVIAGACESVYMYAAMRWLVFRDARDPGGREIAGVAQIPEVADLARETSTES